MSELDIIMSKANVRKQMIELNLMFSSHVILNVFDPRFYSLFTQVANFGRCLTVSAYLYSFR